MSHSLRVNGSSNVVYFDHLTRDLMEGVMPIIRRNLPGIWGAELNSRLVRYSLLDQHLFDSEAGVIADICMQIWDQHHTGFLVEAQWLLCQQPFSDEILTIECLQTNGS